MKQSELQEIIKYITKAVIKEYFAMSSNDKEEQGSGTDQNMVPMDTLTPAEQAKLKRDKEIQRRDLLKQKEKELDVAKKESDFQKQKVDQFKRFQQPNLTKDIQRLKGAQI